MHFATLDLSITKSRFNKTHLHICMNVIYLSGIKNKDKKMKKKLLYFCFAAIMICASCGAKTEGDGLATDTEEVSAKENTADGEDDALKTEVEIETITPEVEAASSANTENQKKDLKPIRVATTGQVNLDIIDMMSEELEYQGYEAVKIECQNYNEVLDKVNSSDALIAFGINEVLLNSYNKRNSANLVIDERIYISPFGIFAGTVSNLNEIPSNTKVLVDEGSVNMNRALYLLSQKGWIDIKPGSGYQASKEDIVNNPKNLEIVSGSINESAKNSYGLIVCDVNKAVIYGLDPQDKLTEENRNSGALDLFAVSVISAKDNVDDQNVKLFLKIINSDSVEKKVTEKYGDSILDYK